MIYAEWTLYGEFFCEFFSTWDAFFQSTFNPDIEIKFVKEMK